MGGAGSSPQDKGGDPGGRNDGFISLLDGDTPTGGMGAAAGGGGVGGGEVGTGTPPQPRPSSQSFGGTGAGSSPAILPPHPPQGGQSGPQRTGGGWQGAFGLIQRDDGFEEGRRELAVTKGGAEPGLEEPLQA